MALNKQHLRRAIISSLLGLGAARALGTKGRAGLILFYILYGMGMGVAGSFIPSLDSPVAFLIFLLVVMSVPFMIYDAAVCYLLLEREEFQGELALAHTIQGGLFPEFIPLYDGWNCCGYHRPAQSVGGDYWDVIAISPERALLVVADVSGKGIPAAILMSAVRGHVHLLAEQYDDVAEMATHLNRIVWGETSSSIFATAWIGILDEERRTLECVSAGHPPALLVRAGGPVEKLGTGGLPVGILEESSYEKQVLKWAEGDRLVVYSDGVLDIDAERGKDLAPEDLVPAIRQAPAGADEVLEGVKAFVTGTSRGEPDDDLTLLVCTFR